MNHQHLPWWNILKLENKINVDLDYWKVKNITCKIVNNVQQQILWGSWFLPNNNPNRSIIK